MAVHDWPTLKGYTPKCNALVGKEKRKQKIEKGYIPRSFGSTIISIGFLDLKILLVTNNVVCFIWCGARYDRKPHYFML